MLRICVVCSKTLKETVASDRTLQPPPAPCRVAPADSTSTMSSSVVGEEVPSEVTKEWSATLMKKLFKERPRFCDIAIKCVDDTLYAHRAVLASRTKCASAECAALSVQSSVSQAIAHHSAFRAVHLIK